MKNNKHKLFAAAIELGGLLKAIEELLNGYSGVEGNENYVKYCLEKAKTSSIYDSEMDSMYDDTYNSEVEKRKGINIATLLGVVKKRFKLLDDIDTAGDMFKPVWCKFTSVVDYLQKLRWLHVYIENEDGGEMKVNGDPLQKEDRVGLTF